MPSKGHCSPCISIVIGGFSFSLSLSPLTLDEGSEVAKSAERPPDGSRRSRGPFCTARPRQWSSLWGAAGSHRGLRAGSIVLLHAHTHASPSPARGQRPPPLCAAPYLPWPPPSLFPLVHASKRTMASGEQARALEEREVAERRD